MEQFLHIVERVAQHIADLKAAGKLIAHQECPACFNSGFKEHTTFDAAGTPYKGVVKCYECRHWELYSENLKAGKK